jgi:hypothetical protein
LVRVGSNGRVRSKWDRADVRNIGGGRDQLEGGLLLDVSNVDRDLAGTVVLQGRSRAVGVLNPLDSLRHAALPRGRGNGGGGLYFVHSQRVRLTAGTRGKNPRKGTRTPGWRRSKPTRGWWHAL